jgi:hypothetical protein
MQQLIGLSADFDCGEGQFTVPKELDAIDTVARVDIISDWLVQVQDAHRKALGECFIDIAVKQFKNATFQQCYAGWENAADGLDFVLPENIQEICKEYFANYRNSN